MSKPQISQPGPSSPRPFCSPGPILTGLAANVKATQSSHLRLLPQSHGQAQVERRGCYRRFPNESASLFFRLKLT